MKIGLIDNCFEHDGLAAEVKESVLGAAWLLEKIGCLVPFLPHRERVVQAELSSL